MEIELLPDPRDDLVARAAAAALAQEGLMGGIPPVPSGGAWRRAGLHDAVDRDASPDGSSPSRVNPMGTDPIDAGPSDARPTDAPRGSGPTG